LRVTTESQRMQRNVGGLEIGIGIAIGIDKS